MPRGLPMLSLPSFNLDTMQAPLLPALIISVVGFVESMFPGSSNRGLVLFLEPFPDANNGVRNFKFNDMQCAGPAQLACYGEATSPSRSPPHLMVTSSISIKSSTRHTQLHPVVVPHVSHFKHVPFRTMVKLWHSVH